MHIEISWRTVRGKNYWKSCYPKYSDHRANPIPGACMPTRASAVSLGGLITQADPAKRILLEQLPRLLRGYGKTPGIDAVVVILDTDKRDCAEFLRELKKVADDCHPPVPHTLFRLAIEEIEAWYFGDRQALLTAYPRAKRGLLDGYVQDSACDTWELLADAIYPGGSMALKKAGWPLPGQVKYEWAEKIGPFMDLERNQSPSFGKLRDGLRRLVARSAQLFYRAE